MADPVFACLPPKAVGQLQITIPVLGALKAAQGAVDKVPTPSSMAMQMLAQIGPALAPFVSILRFVDVAITIEQALKDVLDPLALAKDLEKLSNDIGLLSEFIPGVPYAKMVRDMLDMVAAILSGIASKMLIWVKESQSIGNAIANAKLLGDTDLANSAQCAITRLTEAQQATQISMGVIGQLLKAVKLIADIITSVVPIKVPGLSEVTDVIDTLTNTLASPAGLGTPAEEARMLSLANELNSISTIIHNLSVNITQLIGQ